MVCRTYSIDSIAELHLGGDFEIVDDGRTSAEIAASIIAESKQEELTPEKLIKMQLARKV